MSRRRSEATGAEARASQAAGPHVAAREGSGADARRVARSAPVFAALGDARRLGLLSRLSAEGPLSITELTRGSDVTRQAITKHLEVLAEAGLVRDARSGRERFFDLAPGSLDAARSDLEAISAKWDAAIERLRAKVED